MIGYRIIEKDNQWSFEFIPTNNKTQPVGYSATYSSKEKCYEEVNILRDFVKTNNISSEDSAFVNIVKTEKGHYFEYLFDGKPIFLSREYVNESSLENCKKGIAMIYKQIDDYTKNEVK